MSAHTSGDPRASGSWLTLAAFCALVALTQVLWLSFAPVTDDAEPASGEAAPDEPAPDTEPAFEPAWDGGPLFSHSDPEHGSDPTHDAGPERPE